MIISSGIDLRVSSWPTNSQKRCQTYAPCKKMLYKPFSGTFGFKPYEHMRNMPFTSTLGPWRKILCCRSGTVRGHSIPKGQPGHNCVPGPAQPSTEESGTAFFRAKSCTKLDFRHNNCRMMLYLSAICMHFFSLGASLYERTKRIGEMLLQHITTYLNPNAHVDSGIPCIAV